MNFIPKFDLDFHDKQDCIHNRNYKCPNCEKCTCVASYVDDSSGIIYGNFIPISNAIDNSIYNIPIDSFQDTTDPKVDLLGRVGNLNMKCLEYDFMPGRSSFKKVYIGMKDSKGKEFITTDETLSKGGHYDNEKELRDDTIRTIQRVKNEILIQQILNTKYPDIVPKVYAANLYVYDMIATESMKSKRCSLDAEYRLQLLMERADTNGFEFIVNITDKRSTFYENYEDKQFLDTLYYNLIDYKMEKYHESIVDLYNLYLEYLENSMGNYKGNDFENTFIYKRETYEYAYDFFSNYADTVNFFRFINIKPYKGEITLANTILNDVYNFNHFYFNLKNRVQLSLLGVLNLCIKYLRTVEDLENGGKGKLLIDEWLEENELMIKPLMIALHKIHNSGYIHGDIKDDNFAWKVQKTDNPKSNSIKIIDFGIAATKEMYYDRLSRLKSNIINLGMWKSFTNEQTDLYLQLYDNLFENIFLRKYEDHPLFMELNTVYQSDDGGLYKNQLFLVNTLFITSTNFFVMGDEIFENIDVIYVDYNKMKKINDKVNNNEKLTGKDTDMIEELYRHYEKRDLDLMMEISLVAKNKNDYPSMVGPIFKKLEKNIKIMEKTIPSFIYIHNNFVIPISIKLIKYYNKVNKIK